MTKLKVTLLAGAALAGALGLSTAAQAEDNPGITQGIAAKAPRPVKIEAKDTAAASTDEHVILARLKGIVILANPAQVKAGGASGSGIVVNNPNVPASVAAAAKAYVGKSVSPASLDRLTRDMVLAYRAAGLPVVNVVVPPQDVTNGTVQIVAILGHLGRLTVEGNARDPGYYTEGFTLHHGDVITEAAVVDQLRWKSRRANKRVDAIYAPGSSFGTTDIAFDVKETKPWSVFIGADNTGAGALGELRLYTGFVIDSLFGTDSELSYQYTTSEKGPGTLSANAATLTIPVHGRTDFQLSGSYVASAADIGAGTVDGTSYSLGGQFISQLPRLGTISLDAHYGFEYKNSNNDFLFGGASASATTTEVGQAFLQIFGEHASGISSTHFDVGAWASPGGLFANNNDAAFDAARKGAVAEYVYGRANLDQVFFLPHDFMFEAKFEGQLASARLNPSEMMYLGGLNSVRGFNEDSVKGDNGAFGRFQLFSPAASLLKRQDALRAYGFFDIGTVGVNGTPAVGEGAATIAGAGLGMTYQLNNNLSAEVAYGWRVMTDALVPDSDPGAFHFRVMARF